MIPVVRELQRRGWTAKRWTTKKGRKLGGKPFSKASLFRLLTNVIYTGNVDFKGTIYNGEHEAIIDADTWQQVQETLRKKKGSPCRNESRNVEPGNIPRLSKLMALAIRFEGLVERGELRDYADLARLGYVTRARITQIMNLLNLAPDIQEELLFLPRTVKGRNPRSMKKICTPS